MNILPIPINENKRLKALKDYHLLDTLPEVQFDRLTKLASIICGVPISLISLLDKERQWFKSNIGFDQSETKRDISFCQYTVMGNSLFTVADATKDERFQNNPLVLDYHKVHFYAGYPLIDPDGYTLGSLCIIDSKPKKLTQEQEDALDFLAKEVVSQIIARKEKIKLQNYETLFKVCTDLICVAGTNGYFKELNPAFSQTLGWDNKMLLDTSYFDFIHPDDVEVTQQEIQKLSKGAESINFTTRFRTKNKDYKILEWVATHDELADNFYAIVRDITANKQLEDEFKELSEFQQIVLNGTKLSIISVDLDGIIRTFNRGSEAMLGYEASEVVGLASPAIIHEVTEVVERARALSKELGRPIKPGHEVFITKAQMGITDTNEWTYIRKNKTRLTVELSVNPLRGKGGEIIGFMGIARDINSRKIWERQLALSEEKHRGFFEHSQGLMCTHDFDGNFITVNPAGADLLGYSIDEVLKKSLFDIVAPDSRHMVHAYLKEISRSGYYNGLMKIVHRDGSLKTWMYNNVVSELLDGRKYVIGNGIDITERIALEKDLYKARVLAEQNAHAKDTFLANMSHEIRTPMNAITGFANLLKETKLEGEQFEYVSIISNASENLLGIINDILDISKIESGHIILEEISFKIKETVKNVKDVLTHKAIEKGINLEYSIDERIPDFLIGDPTRLNQILLNLINNAIKFTIHGSVKIVLELKNNTPADCTVLFSIIDTGIGIAKNKLELIFDRFAQANTDTTRKFGGTGLGLSISKSLIELQKGSISVESIPGEGSTFQFQLSFKKSSSQVTVIDDSKVLYNNSIKKVKVLLVEDNNFNQKLALKVLTKFGFEAELAENGKIATEKVQQNMYDVILMDLQMPEMDGYQATEYIRSVLKDTTPIIAMTAHSLVGEKDKCISIGMNDYIPKPFSQKELFNKITNFVTAED